MSSDPFNDKNNLPPWLRDIPLPPRPPDREDRAAAAQPGTPRPTVQLPAWPGDAPREGSEAAPTTPPADTPDWLSAASQSSAAEGMNDQSGLPDWLRDSQASQAPSSGGAEPLPSWLQDTAGTPAAPERPLADQPSASSPGEVQLPDWLRESQRDAPAAAPEQLPDWLRDMAGEVPIQEEPKPTGEQTRWPQEQLDEGSPAESADIPDWLREQTPDAPASPTQPAIFDDPFANLDRPGQPAADRGAAATGEPTTQDWLQDISANTGEIDSAVEPFTFEESPGTVSNTDTSSLPAWLGSVEDTDDTSAGMPDWLKDTSSQATSTDEPAAPTNVPSWLADTTSDAPAQNEPPLGRPDVPLWLQDIDQGATDSASTTPPAPANAEPRAEEVPPWLQETPAAQPPAAAEVPSWLQGTSDQPPAAEEVPPWQQETPAAQPPAAAEVPSWLQEAPTAQPPAESLPSWLQDTSAQPPTAEEMPAWLQETPAAQTPPAAEEVPPWLQATSTLQDTAAPPPSREEMPAWPHDTSAEQPAAEAPPKDLPAWLHGTSAAETAEPEVPADTTPSAPAPEPPEQDNLPDWLRPAGAPPAPTAGTAQDVPPWLRDETGQPLPTAGAPGDTNLPAWLRGATIDRSPAAETSRPPAAPASQPGSTNFDWFADEPAPALPQASANNANNELVGGIELPAWLRPPEPEQPKELNPTDARSLDWLTRLGGHEEEESATAVAAPAYKLKPPSAPTRTAAQVEAIALLQRLAAQPYPEAEPVAAAAVPSVWQRFGFERLLYLAFLILLVAALALPISGSIGLDTPPLAPGAEALFAQIDRLTENDTVLVGYEWDARRSGELRPLEQAVLGHLIAHKVKLVLVSTDAQGTLLLFDLRDKLGAAGYKPSGEDYILLGYKPGAELALRSIGRDFRGALRSDFQGNDATSSGLATNPGGQPRLNSLADFAMVLVLADEPIDVQGWMEQVRPSAKKADGSPVPFGFLLPAETAPIVQPYLSQPSIYHLAGKQGALAYQRLRGDNTAAQIAGEAGQQRLSLIIYVALFVIGAIAIGASGAVARGRRRA